MENKWRHFFGASGFILRGVGQQLSARLEASNDTLGAVKVGDLARAENGGEEVRGVTQTTFSTSTTYTSEVWTEGGRIRGEWV